MNDGNVKGYNSTVIHRYFAVRLSRIHDFAGFLLYVYGHYLHVYSARLPITPNSCIATTSFLYGKLVVYSTGMVLKGPLDLRRT